MFDRFRLLKRQWELSDGVFELYTFCEPGISWKRSRQQRAPLEIHAEFVSGGGELLLLLLFGELFIEPIMGAQVALPAVGCVPPGLAWSTLQRGGPVCFCTPGSSGNGNGTGGARFGTSDGG